MNDALVALDRLVALADEAGIRTVASELRDERLPALRAGQLAVVVLGEFNHGKSTLINALLGANVLPVGITPTTAVVTRVLPGTDLDHATVVFDDDKTQRVGRDKLETLVREENDRVRHVVVQHGSDVLGERVEIIDTPGVNDISQQKVEVTYGIVPRADVVVLVLDATQVLKRTELRFIEKRLLSSLHSRLLFVLGKVDRLDDEEAAEVERYARQRLEALLGSVEIFPLSARRAQNGRDPGFERFRDHLTRFVRQQRDRILLDSALGTGLRSGSALLGNLQIKRRGYQLAQDELERRVETVRAKLHESRRALSQNVARIDDAIANLAGTARHNLRDYRSAFVDALPREIEKVAAEDVQRYLPGFIEQSFRDFLEREGRALGRALDSLAEDVIAITNENLRETVDALKQELGIDPETIDVSVSTTAYDFGVFAMGAVGVSVLVFINALIGGVIALATPIVALVLKGRLEARVKDKATQAGIEAINAVGERAEAELVGMVEAFGGRLRRFVEDAGDRLYRQIEDALGSVLTEKAAAGGDATQLDAEAGRIEDAVRVLLGELRERRERLWEDPA